MASCDTSVTAKMKHRVSIQSVSQADDGQGGRNETWTTLATVWASIEPQKAYERIQAMSLAAPATHKVTIRYYAGLTAKHRILYGTRILNIKEVINVDEANFIHRLLCVEG